jgi:hypothetical protein
MRHWRTHPQLDRPREPLGVVNVDSSRRAEGISGCWQRLICEFRVDGEFERLGETESEESER